MNKKEKINEVKAIYDIEISNMLDDVDRWKQFLDFSSKFYKYSFAENLLMFAQRPTVTMCATMKQWNSVGRWINRGAKGIRLICNKDHEISLKYVFDVKDTHGDDKILFKRWSAESNQIINLLKSYFKYGDENTLEQIVSRYIYESFGENAIINGLPKEQLEMITPDFIENIIKFTTYNVAKRCNISIAEEKLFSKYGSIATDLELKLIGCLENNFSSEILRIVELKVQEYNEEVKEYGETRKIWSEDQEKSRGEIPIQISGTNHGRNDNGQVTSEGKGDYREEREDREQLEKKIQETNNEQISRTSEIQPENSRDDRRILASGNRGNDLESQEVAQEKATSFSLSENQVSEELINKAISMGSMMEDWEERVKVILLEDTLSNKEKASRIKAEYGWCGASVSTENESGFFQVDTKGKGIKIEDYSTNAKITLSWHEVTKRLRDILQIENERANQKEDVQLNLFNNDWLGNDEIYANDDVVIEREMIKQQVLEEKNNYHIPDDFEKHQNLKIKYRENVEAIKLLRQIEGENRLATKDEQAILAKYNGWGGLAKVFNKEAKEWKEEYQELQTLLNNDEYENARASVLNSFYTDKTIIDSVYAGLSRLGFRGGNILEPSSRNRKFFRKIAQGLRKNEIYCN